MQKPVFTWQEARRVARGVNPAVLRLDLHNWRKKGEFVLLKRGAYMFADRAISKADVARCLYPPAYMSLEWALHEHGLIPDVVFAVTLVSPRGTRRFVTPVGEFIYHKIKQDAFGGYDPDTLLATPEKAMVDYFYIHSSQLVPNPSFWKEMRWQNLEHVNFKQAKRFAKQVGVKKVLKLVKSLEEYGKTQEISRRV